MTKKIFLLLFLNLSIHIYSQCPTVTNIYIRSQSSVDNFLISYPNCTEISGSIIIETDANSGTIYNFNGFKNIKKINGNIIFDDHSPLVRTLNGFENLNYVGGNIYINDTWMNDISGIRNLNYVGGSITITSNLIKDFSALNNITYLGNSLTLSNDSNYCSNSNLKLKLTQIPGDFNYLTMGSQDFDLTGLESITKVGGNLKISNWELKNLQGLSGLKSVTGSFSINSSLNLESLDGINSLTNIGRLSISGNRILTNISSLNKITTLDKESYDSISLYIGENEILNSLYGLHNLTSIKGRVFINGNQNLTSINDLSKVDLKNVTDLKIRNNFKLALCQELNICNYLFQGKTNEIYGNATGCSNFDELINSCNIRWKNNVNGTIKTDYENNGCNIGNDKPMENILVKATNGATTFSTFTNQKGEYSFFIPQGNFSITAIPNLNNFSFTPSNANISFVGVGGQQTVNFCSTANQQVNDLRISFYPLEVARPGFETRYRIHYENKGTTIMNGSINFSFDDNKMDFIDASTSVLSQIQNQLNWNISNLYPYQSGSITVKFKYNEPPIVNQDDSIKLIATINPIAGDSTPNNNTFSMNQKIVNSFDPNDKTVLEGETILVNNIGNYLNYLVRFQNTGNASAVNVKVIDELDPNLDYSTFELVGLSHTGRVQLKNNVAEFIFNDINLPDSTSNEKGSHGYISYRVKPKSTTLKNNYIKNYASIYFDYNEPIITNTVSTFVDADTDNDTVYDSKDNCVNISNLNQSDIDNDGIGDLCDDNIEVNPPYFIGFDSPTLDSFWKTYKQYNNYNTDVTVVNYNDVDDNGNTIKLYSSYSGYKTMLISPRLNNLTTNSKISFWLLGATGYYPIQIGFMTDPSNPNTFTKMTYGGGNSTMKLYTLDMSNYQKSFGRYFAILVYGSTLFVDDFKYETNNLAVNETQFQKFKLFPNPTNSFLNIDGDLIIDSISIYDLNGRKLKTEKKFNQKNINLSINDLSKGIYLVEILSNGLKQIKKIVKN